MTQVSPPCERCGAPSLVHVSREHSSGVKIRHFCLECAALRDEPAAPTPGLNRAAVLMVTGAFIVSLSLFADYLKFGDREAFGPKQIVGVSLAAVLFGAGVIVRIPTVLMVGLMLGGLTVLADWLAFGSIPGFGWQQITGTCLGLLLVGWGWRLARRIRS